MTASGTPNQTSLIRHIIPVVIGGLITLVLTIATDSSLAAHGMLPGTEHPVSETGPLLLIAAYRGLFATLGCHFAARLAPAGNPRIRYALALGGVLFVMNVAGASTYRELVPMWYTLVSVAMTVPYAIIGGGTAARVMARSDASVRR